MSGIGGRAKCLDRASGILELFPHLAEGPAFIKAVTYRMNADWPLLLLGFLEVKVDMNFMNV